MKNITVLLRESQKVKTVSLNDDHISIHEQTKERWQKILDITVEILNVPAGLIMKLNKDSLEVFVKSSNTENPYKLKAKDKLRHGLYCETAIGTDEKLEVKNALNDEVWKDNPDIKLNMIAYLGFPLKWPDGSFFGTICVLDNKPHKFSNLQVKVLEVYKEAIEADLKNLQLLNELNTIARVDVLTELDNRRSILEKLEAAYHLYNRNKDPFCCVMVDVNDFKLINDSYGHQAGDEVLKAFAKLLRARLRVSDSVGRLGGDEFLLILRNTTLNGAKNALREIQQLITFDEVLNKYNVTFSYGVTEMSDQYRSVKSIINFADKKMLLRKNKELKF